MDDCQSHAVSGRAQGPYYILVSDEQILTENIYVM